MSEGFREWKRGMWAAIMQRSELAAENKEAHPPSFSEVG